MTVHPPSDPFAGQPAPPSLAPADAHPAPAAPAAPAPWTKGTAAPAPPSPATGWVIAAMILFWPLAIPAYLASQRSARALGAGDLATAEREGRSARTLGIVAVVVAAVWALLSVVLAAALVLGTVQAFESASGVSLEEALDAEVPSALGGAGPAEDGVGLPPGPAGEKTWGELAVGDCFDGPDVPEESFTVPLRSCDEPHVSEVFAVTELPEGEWPGLAAVDERAFGFCTEQFTTFVGEPYDDSSLFLWPSIPTEGSWHYGDRVVACIVEPSQGTVTGTLQGVAAGDA